LVGALTAQLVGSALHKLPLQVGPPATQLCAPVAGLPRQAALPPHVPAHEGSLLGQLGQQLST
jgi:hypothetical protein